MKIIFFGSDDFSLQALKACLDAGHQVQLIVTTPDQKKGRGMKLSPTPVKVFAEENKIKCIAPAKLKDPELINQAKALSPELFVVSSYGKFIPSSWLEIPSNLSINVHPSLLPKHRGASPLNRPILEGDSETGVTIMEVINKLDAGDIFAQEKVALDETMDSEKLAEDLAKMSYPMVQKILQNIEKGPLKRVKQNESESTYAEKLTKEDGKASFNLKAVEISRKVRGLKPWPGTYVDYKGTPLILVAVGASGAETSEKPGALLKVNNKEGSILVATSEGAIEIRRVKPSGKKEMSAADFTRGQRLEPGYNFFS